jgi:hypothetical protein
MWIRLFSLILLTSLYCQGEIIPSIRRITWEGNVGHSAGTLPSFTIFTNLSPLGGSLNDYTNILASVNRCPEFQYVKLGVGTFNGNGTTLNFGRNHNKALIGSGVTTILYGPIASEEMGVNATAESLASGYTKGSTTLVFSGAPSANIFVGNIMEIRASDDTNFIYASSGPAENMATQHRILSVSGTTVTFRPPLVWDYTGLSPKAHGMTASAFGVGLTNFGVENLTLLVTNGTYQANFQGSSDCWLKNVVLTNAQDICLFMYYTANMEVRRCRFDKVADWPSQADGQQIVSDSSSFYLIEDNIFTKGVCGFLGKYRNGGGVIAYNYFTNMNFLDLTRQSQGHLTTTHGAGNMMGLVEGNVVASIMSDGYHGSDAFFTYMRNWVHGLDDQSSNRRCFDLARGARTNNLVGNIVGDASWTNAVGFAYQPLIESVSYAETQVIYRFGWPNSGGNTWTEDGSVPWLDDYPWLTYPDQVVTNSIILHGNYDYATHTQIWDGGIADHDIPDSYFRSSEPQYFVDSPTSVWPPFDPEHPELASPLNIPAGARYYGVEDEPAVVTIIKEIRGPVQFRGPVTIR